MSLRYINKIIGGSMGAAVVAVPFDRGSHCGYDKR